MAAFRLPDVGGAKAAAYSRAQSAAPPPPPGPHSRPGGGLADKRPKPADRQQGFSSLGAASDDGAYRPYTPGAPSPNGGGPAAVPPAGGERLRSPTRKGKKRTKSASQSSSSSVIGVGVGGGYEINVFGPNGGRSYTIVDGLSPAVGRRHSGEEVRGGGGGGAYPRPPRQTQLAGGQEEGLKPWKNDKHWVGHSLHSQEAAENLPFLF